MASSCPADAVFACMDMGNVHKTMPSLLAEIWAVASSRPTDAVFACTNMGNGVILSNRTLNNEYVKSFTR